MGEGGVWTYLLISLNKETQDEMIDRLVDLLARKFKLGDHFLSNLALESVSHVVGTNITEQVIQEQLLSEDDCLQTYERNFTKEAKAAIIFMEKYYRYLENENMFSLPRFLLNTLKSYTDKGSELDSLIKNVTNSMDTLTKGGNLAVGNMLNYFLDDYFFHPKPSKEYASCSFWFSNTKHKECQELQSIINDNYDTVLKVMKYTKRPFSYKVNGLREKEELEKVGRELFFPKLEINNTKFLTHYNPTVNHCHYGYEWRTNHVLFCDDVLTTYTNMGLGYSINAANFYEIFKRTPYIDTFCKELVETGNNECRMNNSKILTKPGINGPSYALRLILHIPKRSEGIWDQQIISIHHAKSVAFMSGNTIIPTPGVHTKVVVTPRVTRTDEALSQTEVGKKNCLSAKHDPNPLTMFNHYSRENCLFECQVKYAERISDCVPWSFPRVFDNSTLCTHGSKRGFIDDLQRTAKFYSIESLQKDCSHCIDECDRVDYEYVIQTTAFQDICNVDGAEGDSIEESSNVKTIERYLDIDEEDYNDKIHFKEMCLTYAHESIATVEVYVGPPKAVHITRSPRVTFLQQVANLGGMIALFTGMSILTLFEFLFWLIEAPLHVHGRKKVNNSEMSQK